MGELDEAGFAAALQSDPDGTLAMLPDLLHATDERLRAQARRLAGRVVVDRARRGVPYRAGPGRPRTVRADRPGSDLDIDASLDALVHARCLGRPAALHELSARDWGRTSMAVCLVVDRSGSMAGDRLAAAAMAAAACAWRAPQDHAVLVFSSSVIALQELGGRRRGTGSVVDDLLALRGRGTTDLGAALAGAAAQLGRSHARRKLCVLLSDCQGNTGADPVLAAAALDELIVVAPAGDGIEAEEFARRAGARWTLADGPLATVGALAQLLA